MSVFEEYWTLNLEVGYKLMQTDLWVINTASEEITLLWFIYFILYSQPASHLFYMSSNVRKRAFNHVRLAKI